MLRGLLGVSFGLGSILSTLASPRVAVGVDYNHDVRPILSDRCYSCHGPDEGQRKTAMRLDREDGAFAELSGGGRPIVAGKPEESAILQRVLSNDPARRMPPAFLGHDPLSEAEIDVLRHWIQEGADWAGHWAFRTPERPIIPLVEDWPQVRNEIDALVLRRLEPEGLQLAASADRRTLARRAALDLTGLPPTSAAVESFVADPSISAYEAFLDGLLASPRFGEHLAAMWLDAARYADTNGYQSDGTRSMWRWRDWVIDAFNRNLSFDRFTVEQLAGDMLPNAARDQVIASGFNRNHRTTAEGGSVAEEFRVEYVADRAETTATVWLGLTLGCARCHDHKFDPLSQKEYYQFFAYFNNVQEKGMVWNFGNEDPLTRAPTRAQELRLEELESDLANAQSRWKALDARIRKEQAAWERGLAGAGTTDWVPEQGLAAYAGLDGRFQVPSFTGGSIDGTRKPERVDINFADGRVGGAAVFDGTKYIDLGKVGNYDYLDPLSVAAWIYPTSNKNGSIVASMDENPIGTGWGLFLRGGKLWWHMSQRWTDLSVRVETKRRIALHRWQHVLLTYDGKRKAKGVRMYVDGVEQDVTVLFDNLDWPSASNATLKVGGGGGLDNRFTGRIDEVRVYGRVLSTPEARSLASVEPLPELAAIASPEQTTAQADKLRLAFLDLAASPAVQGVRRQLAEARRHVLAHRAAIPTVMVMREGPQRKAYILRRGRYDAHGEPVHPGIPDAVSGGTTSHAGNRLQLARWIVGRSNPLTARVIVNRFWQLLFGAGLVKTVDDFGSQGEAPSNQELLDWLAVEFVESGWDIKWLFKTIMLSATYRQTSRVDSALLERDPENRLLARGPRFRMAAGAIRDQALAASGLLHEQVGGPSVKPYQPAGLWKEVSGAAYEPGSGSDLYRRSLYTYWKRTVAPPSMMNFDASDREVCTVYVKRTNTPLQALNLMNDVTYVEAARSLAERVLQGPLRSPRERIREAYRRVLGRDPQAEEADVVEGLLRNYAEHYARDADAAHALVAIGESARGSPPEAHELAAYMGVASLVLNLDETVTKQ